MAIAEVAVEHAVPEIGQVTVAVWRADIEGWEQVGQPLSDSRVWGAAPDRPRR